MLSSGVSDLCRDAFLALPGESRKLKPCGAVAARASIVPASMDNALAVARLVAFFFQTADNRMENQSERPRPLTDCCLDHRRARPTRRGDFKPSPGQATSYFFATAAHRIARTTISESCVPKPPPRHEWKVTTPKPSKHSFFGKRNPTRGATPARGQETHRGPVARCEEACGLADGNLYSTMASKKTVLALEAERVALEREAYDEKNRLLNKSQFQELLELQTDEEPEFVEEIVAMYVDDAEAMLVELETLFSEDKDTEEDDVKVDYTKVRGVLHKLKGSSSTFGADGVSTKCEELRMHCIGEDLVKCRSGEGSLRELRSRVDELAEFLARYTAKTKEITEAKAEGGE